MRRFHPILSHLALLIVCVIALLPIYWVLKTSLTGENLFIYPPSLTPKNANMFHYVAAWYTVDIPQMLINSTAVAGLSVVSNLVLNAMAYGGSKIYIDIRVFENECVVDVQDTGAGIPEEDRPKVIKPFVRLAKKKTKGTGLGLAIVSRIMRLHGGKLHIVDGPKGGASVQLAWKNAEPNTRSRRGLGGSRTRS